MKVKCITNKGSDLSEKSLEQFGTIETIFSVDIDIVYTVYGISIYDGVIRYLIDVCDYCPYWYPAELFIITDNLLPLEWYFNFFGYPEDRMTAVWSYKEMVFEKNHNVNLLEREKEVMDIYVKRKQEIDEWEELSKFRNKE